MQTAQKLHKILFVFLMILIPFLIWVVRNNTVNTAVFLFSGLLYIFTRYSGKFSALNETTEIFYLFLLTGYFFSRIGLERFFPANNILTLVLLVLFLILIRKFKPAELNLRAGSFRKYIGRGLIIAVLSIAGLAAWFLTREGNPYSEWIPSAPPVVLAAMGIGFAAVNAAYEEGIFRSIFLSVLSRNTGMIYALILQALWFSFLHYRAGFPSGWTGMALTFIFGMMMGILVRSTKGILMAVIIHALADFSIFILIVFRMKGIL